MTRNVIAWGFLLVGMALVVWAAFLALRDVRTLEYAQLHGAARARALAALDRQTGSHMDAVETLTDFVEAMHSDAPFAPRTWSRLQAELGVAGFSPSLVAEVYRADLTSPHPRATRLGRVSRSSLEAGGKGTLPTSLLSPLVETLRDLDGPPDDLAWFSCGDARDDPHLHRLRVLLREDPPPDEAPGGEEGDVPVGRHWLILHTRSTLEAIPDARLQIACDMQAGDLTPELPSLVLSPATQVPDEDWAPPEDVTSEGLDARHPTPRIAPRIRLQVGVPPVGRSAPWWIGGTGLLLFLGGGWIQVRHRRRTAATAGDLGGDAAHEMRTPLTIMRGKLELALRRERTHDYYEKTLRACLVEVGALEHLQDAILLLARADQSEVVREPLDVASLLRAEVARVAEAHPEREVRGPASDARAPLLGDPSLLARAIANLLDNAAAHSVEGGAIRAGIHASATHFEIHVEDDGPGIPAVRHEAVFERFYRGPDVGRRGIAGCGLGLALTRRIAELHGGDVHLDPRSPGKARFVLTLPRGD